MLDNKGILRTKVRQNKVNTLIQQFGKPVTPRIGGSALHPKSDGDNLDDLGYLPYLKMLVSQRYYILANIGEMSRLLRKSKMVSCKGDDQPKACNGAENAEMRLDLPDELRSQDAFMVLNPSQGKKLKKFANVVEQNDFGTFALVNEKNHADMEAMAYTLETLGIQEDPKAKGVLYFEEAFARGSKTEDQINQFHKAVCETPPCMCTRLKGQGADSEECLTKSNKRLRACYKSHNAFCTLLSHTLNSHVQCANHPPSHPLTPGPGRAIRKLAQQRYLRHW